MTPTTFTVTLDWRDYCTAGVSVLLILSFGLAFRSREVAASNNRRSMLLFLWSGVLLFIGHGILFVVAAFVSLEGLWIVNVAFMYSGTRATARLALGLRRLRKEAPAAPEQHPVTVPPPPQVAPPPPTPLRTATPPNGQLLPVQREPNGSGPRPHPAPALGAMAAALAERTATDTITPPGRPKGSQ